MNKDIFHEYTNYETNLKYFFENYKTEEDKIELLAGYMSLLETTTQDGLNYDIEDVNACLGCENKQELIIDKESELNRLRLIITCICLSLEYPDKFNSYESLAGYNNAELDTVISKTRLMICPDTNICKY